MTADQPTVQWRTSSFSGDNGNCVQLAAFPDGTVGVRDSKAPEAGTLAFSRAEIAALVHGIRAGEFDDLTW